MISHDPSAVAGSWVVGTEHHGQDIALTAETDVRLNRLQRSSTISFRHVTQIVYRPDRVMEAGPDGIKSDWATWSEKGEIASLSFHDGVARLTLAAYGPGDRWTTEWSITCDAVEVKTHVLAGQTLRAFTHWILGQWWFWLLLVSGGAFLLGRLLHRL